MATAQVSDQGFILHRRPWRETSLLLECLTREHGRVGLVSRGGRRRGRTASADLFAPVALTWSGRGDLFTLIRCEQERPVWLQGRCTTVGLYANELLVRLLQRLDPDPALFDAYQALVTRLDAGAGAFDELDIRTFEKHLLDALGFGFSLALDAESGEALEPERAYCFDPEAGLLSACAERAHFAGPWPGEVLLRVAVGDLTSAPVRTAARAIFRVAVDYRLEGRTLVARQLWR